MPFLHTYRLWLLIFMNVSTFWRLKFAKSTKFRTSKMAKTAFLQRLNWSKLISRKIWMTEKSWNFHTVTHETSSQKRGFFLPEAYTLRVYQEFLIFCLQECLQKLRQCLDQGISTPQWWIKLSFFHSHWLPKVHIWKINSNYNCSHARKIRWWEIIS